MLCLSWFHPLHGLSLSGGGVAGLGGSGRHDVALNAAQLGVGGLDSGVEAADFFAKIADVGLGGGRGAFNFIGGDATGAGEGQGGGKEGQFGDGFHGAENTDSGCAAQVRQAAMERLPRRRGCFIFERLCI